MRGRVITTVPEARLLLSEIDALLLISTPKRASVGVNMSWPEADSDNLAEMLPNNTRSQSQFERFSLLQGLQIISMNSEETRMRRSNT